MTSYLLYITAIFLKRLLFPIGYLYAICTLPKPERQRYHLHNAIAIDQWGNVFLAPLFNRVMIKPNGYKFGNVDETISSVIGKNERSGTLTRTGQLLNSILNRLEKDHAKKSIEENP